ncbi:hypothetical protein ABZ897_56555 [Nonomuraea sp. NPDC046802]|uniref:hypothetical protein n=1 Tax=Nonomuraea sp. NPDC046802 TaxID=3154919 RepID=UPI0034051361
MDEATFWACVKDSARPDRGAPEPPSHALPADLVHLLISKVGLAEAEVAEMSKEDAFARLQKHWNDGV